MQGAAVLAGFAWAKGEHFPSKSKKIFQNLSQAPRGKHKKRHNQRNIAQKHVCNTSPIHREAQAHHANTYKAYLHTCVATWAKESCSKIFSPKQSCARLEGNLCDSKSTTQPQQKTCNSSIAEAGLGTCPCHTEKHFVQKQKRNTIFHAVGGP